MVSLREGVILHTFEVPAQVIATSSGATQVIAANLTNHIYVIWVRLINADGSPNKAKLQSASTDITPFEELSSDGGGWTTNAAPGYMCRTAINEALNINLNGAGDVAGQIGYMLHSKP